MKPHVSQSAFTEVLLMTKIALARAAYLSLFIVFSVSESKTLTPYQKHRILIQDEVKLINGSICIAVQDKRTQYQNRQLALSRLASILRELLKPPPKKRRETIPTRSSQKKRVESKKKRGEIKRNRQSKIDY